jgi:hypothetical protein
MLFIDTMNRPWAPFDLRGMEAIQSIDLPYLPRSSVRRFGSQCAVVVWALVFTACVATRKWLPALAVRSLGTSSQGWTAGSWSEIVIQNETVSMASTSQERERSRMNSDRIPVSRSGRPGNDRNRSQRS